MNNSKEIKYKINQFKINEMIDIPKILIIGSTNKNSIIKDLLYNFRSIQYSIVFASTTSTNFYNDILPSCNIHNEYSDKIMDNVFNRQSKLLNTLNSTDKRTLVVLDDCIRSNNFFNSNKIRSLYFEGRCWSLPSILTIPYPISIRPEIRCQFDYVFVLPDIHMNYRKKIFEYYGGIFDEFKNFNYVFSCITENNGCMVINNRIKIPTIEARIFWYNVKSIPEFTIDNQLMDNQLMTNHLMNNNNDNLVSNSLSNKRTFDQMNNNINNANNTDNTSVSNSLSNKRTFDQMNNNINNTNNTNNTDDTNNTNIFNNIFSHINFPIGNTKLDKAFDEWMKIWNDLMNE